MITEEELKKTSTNDLKYLLASGIKGGEYNLVLDEYQGRPDCNAKRKARYHAEQKAKIKSWKNK